MSAHQNACKEIKGLIDDLEVEQQHLLGLFHLLGHLTEDLDSLHTDPKNAALWAVLAAMEHRITGCRVLGHEIYETAAKGAA